MQHRLVSLVADGAEDIPLRFAGIRKHVQCLVAVTGEKDGIEILRRTSLCVDYHTSRRSAHRLHATAQPDAIDVTCHEFLHVLS